MVNKTHDISEEALALQVGFEPTLAFGREAASLHELYTFWISPL